MKWLPWRRKKNEPTKLTCPRCGGDQWHLGPAGGMSENIMCSGCEHWYNYYQGIIPMDDLHQVGLDRRPG